MLNAISGALPALFAICCSRVEMVFEVGASAIYPSISTDFLPPPFPPRGPYGIGSPASAVLWGGPPPCALPTSLRSSLARQYRVCLSITETQGFPGSWGSRCIRATFSDPGRLNERCHLVRQVLPSAKPNASAHCHKELFRGSVSRPIYSLSTLRRSDYSGATQDSLPGGLAGLTRAGLITRRVPNRVSVVYILSNQAYPGARVTISYHFSALSSSDCTRIKAPIQQLRFMSRPFPAARPLAARGSNHRSRLTQRDGAGLE